MAQTASRRAFLAGTVTVIAAGAPVASGASDQDRTLLNAIARYHAAVAEADRTDAACFDARRRFEALGGDPPLPEAIYQTERDRLEFHFYAIEPDHADPDARPRMKVSFIEWLQRNPLIRVRNVKRPATVADGFTEEEVASGLNTIARHVREPWPEAQARADEIVAAWDAWTAERHRRRVASGLEAAWEENERADNQRYEAARAIAEIKATTLAGALAKATLIMTWFDGPDDLAQEIAGASAHAEAVSLSVVRDLLELAEAGRLA